MTEYEINELSKKQLKIIDDKLGGDLTFCIKKRINNLQKENEQLKEQIPQWHDLRKNPNDLPEENGKYIIHIKLSEIRSITDTCDFFNGFFGQYINPTAWCELPKFEG